MINYIDRLNKNIRVSYIYNFIMCFRTSSAIWVLYLSSKGLNLIEIGILESLFHVTSFLCEIPTGAIADIYGRKSSVVLGRVFAAVSTVLMIISEDMLGFGISFMFSALSYNLNSGASEALTYDSLKQLGREVEYKKIAGTIFFLMEIGQGMAVVLGGLLSDIRFIYAYLISLITEIIALVIALTFIEPRGKAKEDEEKESFILQIRTSLRILKDRKVVLYLILFLSLISTTGATIYFYCQKHFDNMEFSRTIIAVIFTINSIITAASSKSSHRIEGLFKPKGIIMLLPVLNLIAIIGLSLAGGYYAVLFFFITSFIQGVVEPIFSDYINSLIPSECRATILSLQSCAYSIFMIIVFPVVGLIAEKISLGFSFSMIGVIFIPVIIIIILKLNKSQMQEDI